MRNRRSRNLVQAGYGRLNAVPGGEPWRRVGYKVQQPCLVSQTAYVRVGKHSSAGTGEMRAFRQSEVLRGGKIVIMSTFCVSVGEQGVPSLGTG
jgi:hypothetical protein